MSIKLQVKRGNAAQLPTLAEGEFGLVKDAKKLYIGNTSGNMQIATMDEVKTTYATLTMLATGWNTTAKTYSFESQYPSATYNIDVEPIDCTEEQIRAWGKMVPIGSSTSNVLTAMGTVPAINIPVLVKAHKK